MPEIFKDAKELERAFKAQGYHMQRVLLTKATKEGAKVIQMKASMLAPRDTGQLAEDQLIRVDASNSSAAEVVAKIGPDRKSFYGLFQEFGTAFQSAQPFLQPALDQEQERAIQISGEIVGKGLEDLG